MKFIVLLTVFSVCGNVILQKRQPIVFCFLHGVFASCVNCIFTDDGFFFFNQTLACEFIFASLKIQFVKIT